MYWFSFIAVCIRATVGGTGPYNKLLNTGVKNPKFLCTLLYTLSVLLPIVVAVLSGDEGCVGVVVVVEVGAFSGELGIER